MELVTHKKLYLVSGRASRPLAEAIATELGEPLGEPNIAEFANGEIHCRFSESIRGCDAFIIQTHCHSGGMSINDTLMEQLIMVDAARRASAKRITVVCPHYGYARQDRKASGREPITAKLVANLFKEAGASRLVGIDLHSGQIQGFFDIPVDHLSAVRLFARYLREKGYVENAVVVSPDAGRAEEARRLAERLGLPLAMLAKRRLGPRETSVTYVIGDVEGKRPILVDDIVSTGGTIRRGVEALLQAGALPEVVVMATHAVLVGGAKENLAHPAVREVVFTDTIPLKDGGYTVLSTAELLAQAIRHVHTNQSVSALI